MEWPNLSAETGITGFFIASFLAATLLPGGSEAVLFALLRMHPESLWPALIAGTVGNTLGGMTSWACGRWLPRSEKLAVLAQQERVNRWGSPILLLAWVPVIGDALCVAAGWLRLNAWRCALFMAIGKFSRYALVAQGALW